MTAHNVRQKRCLNAIEETLRFLRRADSEAPDMAALETRYQSSAGILETCSAELEDDQLSEAEAQLLRSVPELARYALHEESGAHPKLNTFGAAADYLRPLFLGVQIEQFWVLCMNASGRLIECRLLQKGTLDETPFYLGQMLRSIVETDAAAVVLSHNHPGGTMRPSEADIRCTLDALKAVEPLGVLLLDHIIIAGQTAVSMRASSEIKPLLWVEQDRKSKLLQDWLKDYSF